MIEQTSLAELAGYIAADTDENRFVARVFFVNDLETYYELLEILSAKADLTVRLSDGAFCKGPDTVPDLRALIDVLDRHKNDTVLVPHLGEYLRLGEATERNAACIYSILNRPVHSKARVWLPIFLAKGLFQSVVGALDEERFDRALFEIAGAPSAFQAAAYSKPFAKQAGLVSADGLQEWFALWDDRKIRSGMSFATRQIRQITPSGGDYALSVVTDPYDYIARALKDGNPLLDRSLGSDEQWASLLPYAAGGSMEEIIVHALNMHSFDPLQVLGNWAGLERRKKWLFFLWYRLGLNQKSDYISYAVSRAGSIDGLPESVACAILDCAGSPNFDAWAEQRRAALEKLGNKPLSDDFWTGFRRLEDPRLKLKILTGGTHGERTEIIECVSAALAGGKTVRDFKTLLQGKYPDLLRYLSEPEFLDNEELREYVYQYKINKVADRFSLEFSNMAGELNFYEFEPRGTILNTLKNSVDAYYLWFDGMGVEWIDLLLSKVRDVLPSLSLVSVDVGTAAIPTDTETNMKKADPATVSETKLDSLDRTSHIVDRSDCNYFSIIAKQFEIIEALAGKIGEAARAHPEKDIVVTSDHGLSRMAAKGFHQTQGIDAPAGAAVCKLGRYCVMPEGGRAPAVTNTVREGNVIAFRTHNHFTASGYAPGEWHGGAAPEEILVPVIHFQKLGAKADPAGPAAYELQSRDIDRGSNGDAVLSFTTEAPVQSVMVEVDGRRYPASSGDQRSWAVSIPGLESGRDYSVRIYPNNIYSKVEEIIHVKRRGLEIDDGFDDL